MNTYPNELTTSEIVLILLYRARTIALTEKDELALIKVKDLCRSIADFIESDYHHGPNLAILPHALSCIVRNDRVNKD